jgi:hypothetical protein
MAEQLQTTTKLTFLNVFVEGFAILKPRMCTPTNWMMNEYISIPDASMYTKLSVQFSCHIFLKKFLVEDFKQPVWSRVTVQNI